MLVRTAKDIGALIRDARRRQGLDQAELAARVGVNRRWVIEVERGKPRAEVGLVLKTLEALGLELMAEEQGGAPDATTTRTGRTDTQAVDIDSIVDKARRPRG